MAETASDRAPIAASVTLTSAATWSSLSLVALLCSLILSARWMRPSRFFAIRAASARLSSAGLAHAGRAKPTTMARKIGIVAHRDRLDEFINYRLSEL